MAKKVSEHKLESMVDSYVNGNISDFWSEVRKLSRKDRDRLIGVIHGSLGALAALNIARRIVYGEF